MSNTGMHLYDKNIRELMEYLQEFSPRKLSDAKAWKCTDQDSLVLRSDMAYELGGGTLAAVSGLGFTTSEELVPESGVYLIGRDLSELKTDTAYARITFLRLVQEEDMDQNKWYTTFRKIDYTRYHVYPEGYMMRISSVKEREPVRVSRAALQQGMDFASVGRAFLEAYEKHPAVEAAQIFFVADDRVQYGKLQESAHRMEQITRSLDQVFKGLSMDCSTCGQKALCDEIEGLKEFHQNSW